MLRLTSYPLWVERGLHLLALVLFVSGLAIALMGDIRFWKPLGLAVLLSGPALLAHLISKQFELSAIEESELDRMIARRQAVEAEIVRLRGED